MPKALVDRISSRASAHANLKKFYQPPTLETGPGDVDATPSSVTGSSPEPIRIKRALGSISPDAPPLPLALRITSPNPFHRPRSITNTRGSKAPKSLPLFDRISDPVDEPRFNATFSIPKPYYFDYRRKSPNDIAAIFNSHLHETIKRLTPVFNSPKFEKELSAKDQRTLNALCTRLLQLQGELGKRIITESECRSLQFGLKAIGITDFTKFKSRYHTIVKQLLLIDSSHYFDWIKLTPENEKEVAESA